MLMDKKRIEELTDISSEVRKDILRMVGMARSGPYETPLAAAGLFVYLYWEELVLVPQEPGRGDRDRFVLGMADAVPALYATLARRGFFEREHLWHYRRLGAMLQAYPDFRRTPGMDAPCLTVQPSLAMAASLAGRLASRCFKPRVVFTVSDAALRSDEFMQEARRIAQNRIPNLFMVVASQSCNALQALRDGWDIREADAEDFAALETACRSFDFSRGAPKALAACVPDEKRLPLLGARRQNCGRLLSMDELDQALEELEVRSSGHK